MKAYLFTTSTIFGLIVVAHIWRIAAESGSLLHEPSFVALTVVAAALSVWGFRLAQRASS